MGLVVSMSDFYGERSDAGADEWRPRHSLSSGSDLLDTSDAYGPFATKKD